LSSMEKEELIYRERNPKDKRILNVYLTQKGTETQKKVEKVFLELDEMCFDGFSQEERIDAINILNRLYENLLKNK
ncbi:MAG: MarR family transcriptional regulator, partial [Romboutsia sp.]|nr:MarR family transcriptional regulator [Romboutsia sp.]